MEETRERARKDEPASGTGREVKRPGSELRESAITGLSVRATQLARGGGGPILRAGCVALRVGEAWRDANVAPETEILK